MLFPEWSCEDVIIYLYLRSLDVLTRKATMIVDDDNIRNDRAD